MVIKEVEHRDVYNNNLIIFSKRFKLAGNKILNYYIKRINDKYDYLKRVKNNNSKLIYLKKWKEVKAHDKMRLRKIKKTEPYPLFYIKNKKQIKKKLNINNLIKDSIQLNYNRILYAHKIYQKLNKNYYYYNNNLKKVKKKKKKIFKLKLNLWNTLSFIKSINTNLINYYNSYLLDLNYQWNFLPTVQNNYWLKSKKKKNFNTIFKHYDNFILRNIYKVELESYKKSITFYEAKFLDNFFYMYLIFKQILLNNYYNKVFFINFDVNITYYNNFYNLLKLKVLNNILLKLNYKNYYNFFSTNTFKINNNVNLFDIMLNKKIKYILNSKKFLNLIYKRVQYITLKLMKAKKWTRHSIAKINTKFLKRLVARNVRLNVYVNDKAYISKKSPNFNYYLSSTILKEEKNSIKLKKYNIYFYQFLKKVSILQERIVKKNHKYNYNIVKKFNFLITFLSYYFKQLFYCLKYIFISNLNKLNLFLLKLKFLIAFIYYKVFLCFIKTKFSKEKNKLIKSNKLFTFNTILYYKKALKIWLNNKRQKWAIKKVKNFDNISGKYIQPINVFKYNPLLNPRHNSWLWRKKQKQKKILSIIKYKINGYLRWFKWEKKRKLNFKYRLMLWRNRNKKRNKRNKNKNKKKYKYIKPEVILLKRVKRLKKKYKKIIKKKIILKKKNKKFKILIKNFKKKYILKRSPFSGLFRVLKKPIKRKIKNIKNKLKLKRKFLEFQRLNISKIRKQKLLYQRSVIKKFKKLYMTKPVFNNKRYKKNYKYKNNKK